MVSLDVENRLVCIKPNFNGFMLLLQAFLPSIGVVIGVAFINVLWH